MTDKHRTKIWIELVGKQTLHYLMVPKLQMSSHRIG